MTAYNELHLVGYASTDWIELYVCTISSVLISIYTGGRDMVCVHGCGTWGVCAVSGTHRVNAYITWTHYC